MNSHITVGQPIEGGWRCVDDAGRPVVLPAETLDAALLGLRVGQRLRVELVDGVVVRAALP